MGTHNELQKIFDRLHTTVDFAEVDFSDVNACACDGDNALHCVVRWGDIPAAKTLIAHGIDLNKAGDLGYTPLHVACMKGKVEMVQLLVEKGADLFAQSDGDLPFTTARLGGHDHICDWLAPRMKKAREQEPQTWIRGRIDQLKREIARLEAQLESLAE
jgi:ankyrin repeat protein